MIAIIHGRSGKRNMLMCSNAFFLITKLLWVILVIIMPLIRLNHSSSVCAGNLVLGTNLNELPPYQVDQGALLLAMSIIYLVTLPYVLCAFVCCLCIMMALMHMPKE